jgi:hypothetical protein
MDRFKWNYLILRTIFEQHFLMGMMFCHFNQGQLPFFLTKSVEPIGIIAFSILLSSFTISLCWLVKMTNNGLKLQEVSEF